MFSKNIRQDDWKGLALHFFVYFFTFFSLVIHFSGLLWSEDAIYIIMRKRFPASDKLGEATTVELGLI